MNCKNKGYKIGDIFEVVESGGNFEKGSIIVLSEDDESSAPRFDLIKGRCNFCVNGIKTKQGNYANLDRVRRIYPPEDNKVAITCEGKTVWISRESAEALNLI